MLFKLPCEFDAGRGYDYIDDFWIDNETMLLLEGSTWFQSRNAIPWINYLEKYLTLVENRLTAPSIGGEVGSYVGGYQYFYQGL